MAIDIGAGATNRSSRNSTNYTYVDLNNPSNASGIIDTFEIYANSNCTNVVIGTAYGSSDKYTSRDSEFIGNVNSGSKSTFTGLNCDVETGDYIIMFPGTMGRIEASISGGAGYYSVQFNKIDGSEYTYTLFDGGVLSLYGTGTETAAGGGIRNPFRKPFYGPLGGPF